MGTHVYPFPQRSNQDRGWETWISWASQSVEFQSHVNPPVPQPGLGWGGDLGPVPKSTVIAKMRLSLEEEQGIPRVSNPS